MQENQKRYYKVTIPSVVSFLMIGLYVFVDAVFVGNGVGELGLAAINIAFSIISLAEALGTGIGMGTSVRYTILKTQGRKEEALSYISVSVIMQVVFSAIITICFVFIPYRILIILGASENIANLGVPYLRVQGFGALVFISNQAMQPIARNEGGEKIAMVGVIAGCVSNIFLDWLLMYPFKLGMFGASLATVLGQVIGLSFTLSFLIKKKCLKLKLRIENASEKIKEIIAIGLSPFALVFLPNITIVIMNHACLNYAGESAVAVYGVISWVVYLVYTVLQGLTDGPQPVISEYTGKNDSVSYNNLIKLSFKTVLISSVVLGAVEYFLRVQIGTLMGAETETLKQFSEIIILFILAFPCVAFSKCAAAIFYASEKNKFAYMVSFSEPVFIAIALLFVNVWYATLVSQICVAIISLVLIAFMRNNNASIKA